MLLWLIHRQKEILRLVNTSVAAAATEGNNGTLSSRIVLLWSNGPAGECAGESTADRRRRHRRPAVDRVPLGFDDDAGDGDV